ncbi:MAG: hypothetical protein KDB88_13105 [Flavobacteriales bacterium]|nr:hypothetical protein [Flavobacteriales bacterium]MCB0795666.1 hypothetical protein [Flavobacteriales bacterium]
MKEDIVRPAVKGVAMAVTQHPDPEGDLGWYVFLINTGEVPLENVLISSRGYGTVNGEKVETSEMRHYLENLGPRSWAKVERIMEEVFALNNQYWLSYYVDGVIHDKKYIFLPESINPEHFTDLPLMEERGVMIT